MSKRVVIHVVPVDKKRWGLVFERAFDGSTSKAGVLKLAQALAKTVDLSQIIVHKRDGTIQEERTYGKDPRRTKG